MAEVILKYPLYANCLLSLPPGARVLSVQAQDQCAVMWVAVNLALQDRAKPREFVRVMTGGAVPKDSQYIGTVLEGNGGYHVVHIFELGVDTGLGVHRICSECPHAVIYHSPFGCDKCVCKCTVDV